MKRLLLLVLGACVIAPPTLAQGIEVTWPTPNPAWSEGKPISAFLQDAGTHDSASGGFGGVRSNGRQFHEGLDIKALERDKRGEATDAVFAAMDGVVRYVNTIVRNSDYGRYIVLEHPEHKPAIYTFYAHLASVGSGIRSGTTVRRGQTLGVMGRSAGSYTIPRRRAHLHFEMGLWLTRDFQSWYDWKNFPGRNDHGYFNGMNLMGFDPLDFLNQCRAGRINTLQDYFDHMRPAVKVRIATSQTPDFVQRYPTLVARHLPMLIAGWEIEMNWTGLPFRWTPLDVNGVKGMRPGEVKITYVDAIAGGRDQSKNLVVSRGSKWVPDNDLTTVLQLLFGLR